jgi:hypothetical protein
MTADTWILWTGHQRSEHNEKQKSYKIVPSGHPYGQLSPVGSGRVYVRVRHADRSTMVMSSRHVEDHSMDVGTGFVTLPLACENNDRIVDGWRMGPRVSRVLLFHGIELIQSVDVILASDNTISLDGSYAKIGVAVTDMDHSLRPNRSIRSLNSRDEHANILHAVNTLRFEDQSEKLVNGLPLRGPVLVLLGGRLDAYAGKHIC